MDRPWSMKIMIVLALAQGLAGLLRGSNWVQIGIDLYGQGLLLLPFVGTLAVMRGLLISLVAILYLLFVLGALIGKSWAWGFCLSAVIVNLLLVLSGLGQGAPVAQAFAWAAIPVILLFYLFSRAGREVLKGA